MYTPSLSEIGDKQSNLHIDKGILVLPAWIQGRVSTKAQVSSHKVVNGRTIFEEKASLEEQEKRCTEAISSYQGNCPKCFREIKLTLAGKSFAKGESGRETDREDTGEIIQAAVDGSLKVLVTIDNDRLARKRATAVWLREQLKEKGIQVYSLAQPVPLKCDSCYDPYDDDSGLIVETVSDMKSQLDLSKIRRNYKIGMPKRIRSGKPSGSLAYGLIKRYKIVGKDPKGNEVLEEYYEWLTDKIRIVRRIANEYLAGKGVWKICQNLNLEGIPSPQGKVWGRSAVLHILKNPAYAGYIRFGWKPVKNGVRKTQPMDKWMLEKAQYKGLWSWEFYEEIQREIARRATIGGRAVSSGGLLIGLLKCMRCKYSMFQGGSRRTLKNGLEYVWKGYVCGTFMHRGTCEHNGIKQERLDSIILNEVLKLADQGTREVFVSKLKKSKEIDSERQLELSREHLKELLDQLERVSKAYREGVDTIEEYAKKKSVLLPDIESATNNVRTLESRVKNSGVLDWGSEYTSALKRFLEYPMKEDKQKVRVILSKLIERVEFRKKPFFMKICYKVN